MEQNQFKCSGNCLQCQPAQRAYCASQHAYSNMKVLDQMMGIVIAMQGDMKEMKEKIEAMQNNEASIFDPNADVVIEADKEEKSEIQNLPIAQQGSGARE